MSWQAQTAVTNCSKQRDVDCLKLLGKLAVHADDNGLIDPAPNYETLADWAGCSTRTIQNRVNRLIDSGELKQTRVGSGPGRPSAYQIILPIIKVERKVETAKEETVNTDYEARLTKLETKVESLGQKVESLAGKVETITDFLSTFWEKVESLIDAKVEKVEAKGGKHSGENGQSNQIDQNNTNNPPYIPPLGDSPSESPKVEKKRGKQPKAEPAPIVFTLDPCIDTPQVRQLLADFEANRREMNKPMTQRGANILVGKLAAVGLVESVARLQAAITNNWQGAFYPGDEDKYAHLRGGSLNGRYSNGTNGHYPPEQREKADPITGRF